jgi:hypothetical protein
MADRTNKLNQYKKLEYSLSSDPSQMYINDIQPTNNGYNFIKGIYNMFTKNENKVSDIAIDDLSVSKKSSCSKVSKKENVIEDFINNDIISLSDSFESLYEKSINSYFECFEETKLINNVVNYKNNLPTAFGYDSSYTKSSRDHEISRDLELSILDSSDHYPNNEVGKYSIYTLSTIIIMSSMYVAKTL